MAKRRNVEVPIALLKISTEQFAHYIENLPSDKNEAELAMNNSISFGIDVAKEVVACLFKFELVATDERPIILIETGVHFAIEPEAFTKLFNRKKKQFTLPFNSACHIFSITVGVARGILHSKTENTVLNGLFIPLLHSETLISEDIIIETSDKD